MQLPFAENLNYADTTLSVMVVAELALAAALPAGAAAFAQRWSLADMRRWPWVGAVVVFAAAVAGALAASALPADVRQFLCRRMHAEPAWWPTAVCFGSLALSASAAMLVSVGWWDRYYVAGRREAFRAATMLTPVAVACGALAWVMLVLFSRHPTAATAESVAVPMTAILMLIGLNAGGLSRAFANRGLDRWASLAVCVVPTLVIGATQYAMLTLVFSRWRIDWGDAAPILGPSATVADPVQMLGRVVIGHTILTTLLAIGGWIGIRAAPRPKIHRRRHHAVANPHNLPEAAPATRSAERASGSTHTASPIDAGI